MLQSAFPERAGLENERRHPNCPGAWSECNGRSILSGPGIEVRSHFYLAERVEVPTDRAAGGTVLKNRRFVQARSTGWHAISPRRLVRKRDEAALREAERELESFPHDYRALLRAAWLYHGFGLRRRAVQAARRVTRLNGLSRAERFEAALLLRRIQHEYRGAAARSASRVIYTRDEPLCDVPLGF
jgi:hypothetical protein